MRSPYTGKNAPQILAQVMSDDPTPDVRDFNPNVPPMLAATIRRMCVKDRERRIATPAALLAEFAKLGYVHGNATPEVSYTPTRESEAEGVSIGRYLDGLSQESDNTLSFETDDAEIQEFVGKLKKKRFLRKLWFAIAMLMLGLAIVLILLI